LGKKTYREEDRGGHHTPGRVVFHSTFRGKNKKQNLTGISGTEKKGNNAGPRRRRFFLDSRSEKESLGVDEQGATSWGAKEDIALCCNAGD